MDKIIVNRKEIEIGPDGRIPLSDEELENTSGGLIISRDTPLFQWKCRDCGAVSDWYDNSSECRNNLRDHILEKNHSLYEFYSKYFV